MGTEALLVFAVLAAVLVALVLEMWTPDFLLLGGLILVTAAGVIDVETALEGFANPTLLTLGSLYVVAAGLRRTGALDRASRLFLGARAGIRQVLVRLCVAVGASSAFLNNTPVVAMGIPAVRGWARRHGVSVSRVLMPLSFAAILGGLCTLIGTSTNLVTHGLLQSHGLEGLGFFELAWIGVPSMLVGWVYLVAVAPRLLPEREEVEEAEEREREVTVEMEIPARSPLAGRTVEAAGLEHVAGHRLERIARDDLEVGPVAASEELEEGDRLSFVPDEDERHKRERGAPVPRELARYPGLRRILAAPPPVLPEGDREVHHVVVKEGSPLAGEEVGELDFLERFNAAVLAVRRGGHRVELPLEEIRLRPGDILILSTGRGFREVHEEAPEFFITSPVGGQVPEALPEREAAAEKEAAAEAARAEFVARDRWVAFGVLVGIVLATALGDVPIVVSAALGAMVTVLLGYVNPGEAREEVDWAVLLVIGASLGLGQALETSGAAAWLARGMVGISAEFGATGTLLGIFVGTTILTNVVTNNGAAALMFPVALAAAQAQAVAPRPLFIALTVAASASFLTPIGYQTNLMVYGPGNYRFVDFFRVGLPLQLLIAAVAVVVIPVVWGF